MVHTLRPDARTSRCCVWNIQQINVADREQSAAESLVLRTMLQSVGLLALLVLPSLQGGRKEQRRKKGRHSAAASSRLTVVPTIACECAVCVRVTVRGDAGHVVRGSQGGAEYAECRVQSD